MRLVIFSMLGPLIGMFTLHLGIWAIAVGIAGAPPFPLWPQGAVPVMVIGAYALGFIPAFFTGAADWFFSSRIDGWRRVLATACAGYFIAVLVAFLWATPGDLGL